MQHRKFLQDDQVFFVSWDVNEYEMSWESKVHVLGELSIYDGDKTVYFSHNSVDAIKALIPELEAFVKQYETVAKKHKKNVKSKSVAKIKASK